MSRALVNLSVYEYLKAHKLLKDKMKHRLTKYMIAGVAKLLSAQNRDGGWGWFRRNSSDPFFTTYVLYYLSSVQRLGILVPAKPMKRAVKFITTAITTKTSSNFITKSKSIRYDALCSYLFYFIANAAVSSGNSSLLSDAAGFVPIVRTYLRTGDDPSAIACAIMGLIALNKNIKNELVPTAAKLASMAKQDGSWKPHEIHPSGGTVEVTSLVLRALSAVSPSLFAKNIEKGLKWLQKRLNGGFSYNTRATAAAITTIASLYTNPKPKKGLVRIKMNGETITELKLSKENHYTEALKLRLIDASSSLVDGMNRLEIEAVGEPIVSVTIKRWTSKPQQRFSIARTYSRNKLTIGSTTYVTLNIYTPKPIEWAVIEEPLPANCILDPELLEFARQRSKIADYTVINGKLYIYLQKVENSFCLRYGVVAQRVGTATQSAPKIVNMYDETDFAVGNPTKINVHR